MPSRKVRRHPQAPPRRCRPSQQRFLPIPASPSGTPEPATRPTTTLRKHEHEGSHAVLTTASRRWSVQRRRGAGTRATAPSAYGRAPPPLSTTVADRTPWQEPTGPVAPQAWPGPQRPGQLPPPRSSWYAVGVAVPVQAAPLPSHTGSVAVAPEPTRKDPKGTLWA